MRLPGIVLVGLLAVLAAAPSSPAADLDEVQKRGELRVLAMVDDPKDEFFTDRPGVGLDRELLEASASLRRVKLVLVPATAWDRLVPMLQDDQADVVAGRSTVTDARRRLVDFTAEVFPTRAVVGTRKPHRFVASVAELRKERVGTVTGTSAASAAGVPPANIDDSIPSGGLPAALKSGRVTAIVLGDRERHHREAKGPHAAGGRLPRPAGGAEILKRAREEAER